MKTNMQIGLRTVFLCYALLGPQLVFAQHSIQGKWSGMFMEQFQVTIEFAQVNDERMEGILMMYTGENIIQNDDLENIKIDGNDVAFYIPAKETEFIGLLNSEQNEISGNFVFPDGSKHALILVKTDSKQNDSIPGMNKYSELRNNNISGERLVKDLDFLKAKLEVNHPQLYRYIDKASFEKSFEKARQTALAGMSLTEFYGLASTLTEMIKCSHTGIKMPANYEILSREYGNYFPGELLFSSGKTYLLEEINLPESRVEGGSEILSINNRSLQKIEEQIFKIIPAEGSNMTTKYFEINNNFPAYFNLIDNSEAFEVEFQNQGSSSISTMIFPARPYSEISAPRPGEGTWPLQFRMEEKNDLALLKISAFTFNDVNRYIDELDHIINNLIEKNIGNLAIDLRGNSGGHPIFAAQLFSYLIDHEFTYFKRNPDILEFEPLYNPMPANPIHYSGNVYALIDGGCLSTTGHLISLLQFYNLAEFIGEQPGSASTCNDFSIQYILPNTEIMLNVPRTTFETVAAGNLQEDTIMVKYVVNKNLVWQAEDPYMELLYDIIENVPSQ